MSIQQILRLTALLSIIAFGLLIHSGCGAQEAEESASNSAGSDSTVESNEPAPVAGAKAPSAQNAKAVRAVIPRKIIYTAQVHLVAENLTTAQDKLTRLVKTHKGYVDETNIGGAAGAPRQGTWKVRVPVEEYEAFMSAVARLGELQTIHSDSQDVSEEYYDLEARLSNKRVEERRLIKHLEKSTARLTDILAVEREISRVRGEIEQMQGRLRLLADLTALTTVTVTINEIKNYVPPAPPTFGAQLARTFEKSVSQLTDTGKGLLVLVVAVAPWLVVLALILVPVWMVRRRRG
ncbi:MAG TPA: DUF4349 domain-containing protein [Abditibacteriaceae bacterium]|nr:DUF4349 domain-containing protein [Abditibacteriaceae bacterium]